MNLKKKLGLAIAALSLTATFGVSAANQIGHKDVAIERIPLEYSVKRDVAIERIPLEYSVKRDVAIERIPLEYSVKRDVASNVSHLNIRSNVM